MTSPRSSSGTPERRHRRDAAAAPLRAVAEAIGDAIVVTDAEGRITTWAGRAAELFGRGEEEVLGRSVAILLAERHREAYPRAFTTAGPRPIALDAVRRDGSEFPCELTVALGEADGERFYVGVVRDVTELRTAQERFRSAFEHAAIGMTMTAPEGRYLRVNHAFARMLGRTVEELTGAEMVAVTHPEDHVPDRERIRRLLDGEAESLRFEKRYLRADGSPVWVEVALSLVRDGGGRPLHFLTQAQDITDRRRAAEELRRSNAELAQFAHVASHDLNEPLRNVDGFLHLLRRRAGEQLDDDARRFVDLALDGTTRMRELIDALLRYARAGADDLAAEELALATVAREALAALASAIAERGVRVDVGELPVVEGDRALLRQVLQNLLANAVRFADPGGPRVVVSGREAGGAVEVSVADNGPGVPEGARERVFEMFAREDARGTGLGLAIARRAVERHGGRIWIAEADGGGADVRFTLPARRSSS
ncbi:MAG: PAS domain S-box protein [Solirubrobacterales bacterium]|nr:PAS domain S-box protein [Solirubrobacterales bacterium]